MDVDNSIELGCPNCGKVLHVPVKFAGTTGSCQGCGGQVEVPPVPASGPSQAVSEETRTCPFCGEQVLVVAKKCKHCNEWLQESAHKIVPSWNVPVLFVLTLGIYFFFWLYRVFNELHQRGATDVSPLKAVGFMFVPFFNFAWLFVVSYKLGEGLKKAYSQANLTPPTAGFIWLLPISLFAGPFVGLIDSGNEVDDAFFRILPFLGMSVALCFVQYKLNNLAKRERGH